MKKMKKGLAMVFAALLLISGCRAQEAPATQAPTEAPTQATAPISGNLFCVEISRFSGRFVEDGKDQPVKDVAAILVQNNTGKFLDLAQITYKVGGRVAQFRVTALPAGRRAWVLESTGMVLSEEDVLELDECLDSYNPNPVTNPEELSVSRKDQTLTVSNTSGKTLKNVTAYYKNTLDDGTFMGGITYVMSFGDMEPGQTRSKSADHFSDGSEIVRYSFQYE